MKIPVRLVQAVVAAGIYNVWLVRPNKQSRWRGGNASTLGEEFSKFGLPPWMMWTIGTLKVASATSLLLGLRYPAVTKPAALSLAALMAGAVSMHQGTRFAPAVAAVADDARTLALRGEVRRQGQAFAARVEMLTRLKVWSRSRRLPSPELLVRSSFGLTASIGGGAVVGTERMRYGMSESAIQPSAVRAAA